MTNLAPNNWTNAFRPLYLLPAFFILLLCNLCQFGQAQGGQTDSLPISGFNTSIEFSFSSDGVHDYMYFDLWLESPSNPVQGLTGVSIDLIFDDSLPSGASISTSLNGSCLGLPSALVSSASLSSPTLAVAAASETVAIGSDTSGKVLRVAIQAPAGTLPTTDPQPRLGGIVIMVENVDLKWAGNLDAGAELALWPQPAQDQVNARWGGIAAARLRIIDLQGRTVFDSGQEVPLPAQLPLYDLPSGSFWLLAEAKGKRASHSLLIR